MLKAKKHLEGNLSPLDYEHINRIVEQVISEINYRFQQNVKIYEIQNIVEHTLLENHEYELAQEYINYRTQRDFKRSQATDINFSIDQLMGKEKKR